MALLIPTLRQALASDALAVFDGEFKGYVRQGKHIARALIQDSADTVVNAFGGGEPSNLQNIVVLISETAPFNFDSNEIVYVSVDGSKDKEQKRIVVAPTQSPDEVTINLLVRSA